MADESAVAADNATQEEPPTAAAAAEAVSVADPPSKPAPAAGDAPKAAAAASSQTQNIEFEPPAACIRRLLKSHLPKSTNVSKDSLAAISRASGIFVLYLTACANDVAREGRRTTVVAKDVLGALKELDFGEFVPLMEKFLEGHRKEEKNKKEEKERLKRLQQAEREKAQGEEGEGSRDATTGQFVAKEGDGKDEKKDEEKEGEKEEKVDEGGSKKEGAEDKEEEETEAAVAEDKEEVTAAPAEEAAAPAPDAETKHAREEEGEATKEGDDVEEPVAKKQKVDEGE